MVLSNGNHRRRLNQTEIKQLYVYVYRREKLNNANKLYIEKIISIVLPFCLLCLTYNKLYLHPNHLRRSPRT